MNATTKTEMVQYKPNYACCACYFVSLCRTYALIRTVFFSSLKLNTHIVSLYRIPSPNDILSAHQLALNEQPLVRTNKSTTTTTSKNCVNIYYSDRKFIENSELFKVFECLNVWVICINDIHLCRTKHKHKINNFQY